MNRRDFIKSAGTCAAGLTLSACGKDLPTERYNQQDQFALQDQRMREQLASGEGPHGKQVYQGYRGLAELPWFELDAEGNLHCVDDSIPAAVDVHCHLGMAVLFSPAIDLQHDPRPVRHLLPECRPVLRWGAYAQSNDSQRPTVYKRLDYRTRGKRSFGSQS